MLARGAVTQPGLVLGPILIPILAHPGTAKDLFMCDVGVVASQNFFLGRRGGLLMGVEGQSAICNLQAAQWRGAPSFQRLPVAAALARNGTIKAMTMKSLKLEHIFRDQSGRRPAIHADSPFLSFSSAPANSVADRGNSESSCHDATYVKVAAPGSNFRQWRATQSFWTSAKMAPSRVAGPVECTAAPPGPIFH